MDKKSISKANELLHSQQCLNDLRNIIGKPYPQMFSMIKRDQKTGFCYNNTSVSFAALDDITREKIKKAIRDVINERDREIDDEIKRL